jgi:hypothetical protein
MKNKKKYRKGGIEYDSDDLYETYEDKCKILNLPEFEREKVLEERLNE